MQHACATLRNHLPARLDDLDSREVSPESPMTHAWGDPAVVMRCGVPRPAAYRPGSPQAADVDGVRWFQDIGDETVTWTAIRPDVNLELVIPTSYEGQGGFLVELGRSLRDAGL